MIRQCAAGAHGLVVATTRPQGYGGELDRIGVPLNTLYLVHLNPEEALHWRRWADIARRGRLEVEFERQIFDEATFYSLVADGTIEIVQQYFAPA